MYAITGISGQVGGALARALLTTRQPVRAVLRDARKAETWASRGCEIALAEMDDAVALTTAFKDAVGVFILLPPIFDPTPGFPEARRVITAVKMALEAARPGRVVCLSTIGAQASQPNLLSQLSLMEQALGHLPMPVSFLRPAWFMENASWDVASARGAGVIPSFLQPLDKKVPMVATDDVGQVAAELIQDSWQGRRVIELEGPRRIAPTDIATAFAKILGRPVHAEAVPRETWGSLFMSQGMKDPLPRIQMLDGFNEGWIEFEGGASGTRKGRIELADVLRELISRAA